jgi:hypothetical protein
VLQWLIDLTAAYRFLQAFLLSTLRRAIQNPLKSQKHLQQLPQTRTGPATSRSRGTAPASTSFKLQLFAVYYWRML